MPKHEVETQSEDRGDEIARLAYSYWLARGCEDGHDVEDWLKAEQEVSRKHIPRPEERRKEARNAA